MKIKGFDAILGPVMSIRSVCLCFEKTGITDFETISKIFSEEEVFLFFFCCNRKMLQNH